MNLIEQLGGYAAAKVRLSGSDKSLSYYQELNAALLEYRRHHNIFEVGDVIIHTDFKCIGRFSKYTGKTGALCHIDFGLGDLTALIKHIRHATDAEISAGHRL